MTYHEKSPVGLGQLLQSLTQSVTGGESIPVALGMVKSYFGAEIVALEQSTRHGESLFFSQGDDGDIADDLAAGVAQPLRLLSQRYLHIAAGDTSPDLNTSYTIWMFRDREAPRFDNEETALASVVVSQLRLAMELAARIETHAHQNAIHSRALECLCVGVVIADEDGTVHSMSSVAQRMLDQREGLQLQVGRLKAVQASENRQLQAIMRAAARAETVDAPGHGMSLTKDSGLRTLGVVARRIEAGEASEPSKVVVYMRDCEAEISFDPDIARRIFDLTPAEAAMTQRLAAGLSLEDAAASLTISRNTARAHLRSIFSKNGVTRQTELVRMVLNSVAPLAGTQRLN